MEELKEVAIKKAKDNYISKTKIFHEKVSYILHEVYTYTSIIPI